MWCLNLVQIKDFPGGSMRLVDAGDDGLARLDVLALATPAHNYAGRVR